MLSKEERDLYSKSDLYFVEVIGKFIRSKRLELDKTTAELALEAGVHRSTISQIENGKPVNLISFIQILRALKQLHILENFVLSPLISPLKMADMQINQKSRAGRSKEKVSTKTKSRKSDW